MANYQINLTGAEIDERLQGVGKPTDVGDASGSLYARTSKNADDIEELNDEVARVKEAQTTTETKVEQNTTDISTLQTTVSNNKDEQDRIAEQVRENASAIGTNKASIADHEKRQTNIEKVSGVRNDIYFKCYSTLELYAPESNDGVVKLYRWACGRYVEFILWNINNAEKIDYRIEKEWKEEDQYFELNIVTEDETMLLSDFVCSYRSQKKRRWAVQLVDADGRPQTALFEFKVSCCDIDGTPQYMLIKNGQRRDTASRKETRQQGFFLCDDWFTAKDQTISLNFYLSAQWPTGNLARTSVKRQIKIPSAGDIVRFQHEDYEGVVISIIGRDQPEYLMLWSDGQSLCEMSFKAVYDENKHLAGAICTSPAETLCNSINGLARKLRSGTLRDLYISAGAKYNEQTGYYELNGLTDITEEEMRVIYQESLAGWYLKGRTNLTKNISAKSNSGGYNAGIDIVNICWNNKNIILFNFGSSPFVKFCDNAFSGCTKLETIDTRFSITPYNGVIGSNIFRGCVALKEVRFNMQYLRYSTNVNFPVSTLISKESILSIITTTPTEGTIKPLVVIGLNDSAYNRLKDDTDIQQAITDKNGFVTLTQI